MQQAATVAALPSLADPGAAFFQTEGMDAAHVDLEGLGQEEEQDGSDDGMEGISGGEEEDGGEEGPSGAGAMDEGEAAAPARGAGTRRQNTQLYDAAAGQFNPHAARAARKRQRKGRGAAAAAMEQGGGSDSDFDFDETVADGIASSKNPFAAMPDGGDA